MNNQISNPKTSVPTGIQLNDKDYINCLLSTLKEMTKNYALAMTEASNEVLYQKYKNIFNSVSDLQRETFELAFRNGWYILIIFLYIVNVLIFSFSFIFILYGFFIL